MIFTVDARVKLGIERWRLQRDGNWRPLGDDLNINGQKDWTTRNVNDTKPYCQSDIEVNLGPTTYKANPSQHLMGEELVTVEAAVHRLTKPHKFTIKELRDVIRNGDDNRNNILIIDLGGSFSLREFIPGIIHDPEIAVRHEAFIAGNGYIGEAASRDNRFIKQIFLSMLNGWIMHLRTGEVNIFIDYATTKTEAELLEELDKINAQLR